MSSMTRPLSRKTIDGRIAWLLRTNRTLGPGEQWLRAKHFATAFHGGSWTDTVSESRISRWETGVSRPGRAAVLRYEEVLGLEHGSLAATVDTIRRYVDPIGPPGSAPGRDPRPAYQDGGLFDLLDRALSTETMTGADWDRLTARIAATPHLVLAPRSAQSGVAERLVSEMIIAHGKAWRQRFEALNRLLRHPTCQQAAVAACAALASDPRNQVFIETVGALDGSSHPDAAAKVLGQLTDPTNDRALRGALLACVRKIRFGHFTPEQLDVITPRIGELLHDPLLRADAHAVALALRRRAAPAPAARLVGPVDAAGLGDLQLSLPSPHEAATLARRVIAAATAGLLRDPGPAADDTFLELVTEILFHPSADQRLYAAMFVAESPYGPSLAAALAAELNPAAAGQTELNLRLLAALRALGDGGPRPAVERIVTAAHLPGSVVDAAAFSVGHLPGTGDPAFWGTALRRHADRWHQQRDAASAGTLPGMVYRLGVAGRRDMLAAVRDDVLSPPPVRTAARWWLGIPDHLYASARL